MAPYLNQQDFDDDLIGLVGRPVDGGGAAPLGIPLVGFKVEATILDFVAECKLTQCYENRDANPVEATYNFPMDESAAVCGFEAEYEDGTTVKGVVKEKQRAKQEYNQALRQGRQANLLDSVRRDIFSLKVGNLAPGAFVKITITYITHLKARDDAAAFILPTFIAPRYSPTHERLTTEEARALASSNSSVKMFGMELMVNITCQSNIRAVSCPTHEAEPSLSSGFIGKTGHLTLQNITMDKDVVVLINEERCHEPRAILEISEEGTMAGFVTLYPKLEFPDLTREFIFLVDQSGSMSGRKMDQTRDTLLLFLRALPVTCTFNIVGFGSKFSSLFAKPISYSDETLEQATSYVSSMTACMGGTEIKRPLDHIFQQPYPPRIERQVFVLTDGQVSNDTAVFGLIRQYCSIKTNTRLFSVGLGAGVSRHLVEGMARAGRGTTRFVEEGAPEALRQKVLGQLKQALQPSLNHVSIQWKFPNKRRAQMVEKTEPTPVKTLLGYRSPQVDIEESAAMNEPNVYPAEVPPVFNRERFLSFALFPKGGELPESVTVSCATSDGILETTLPITKDDIFQGTIAHKMAARTAISEYEDKKKDHLQVGNSGILSKEKALQLALSNGLASEQTSFIAVSDSPSGQDNVAEYYRQAEVVVNAGRPIRSNVGVATSQVQRQGLKLANNRVSLENREIGMDALIARSNDLSAQSKMFNKRAKKPTSGSGMLGGLAGLRDSIRKQFHPNATVADVGEKMEAYYDKDQKVWCFPGEDSSQVRSRFAPPAPPTAYDMAKSLFPASSSSSSSATRQDDPVAAMMAPPQRRRGGGGGGGGSARPRAQQANALTNNNPELAAHVARLQGMTINIGTEVLQQNCLLPAEEASPLKAHHGFNIKNGGKSATAAGVNTASSKVVAPEKEDKLLNLCLLQKANGSFAWSSALFDVLGLKDTDILNGTSMNGTKNGNERTVLATTLAIAALKVLFGRRREEWELQADKALQWLAQQVQNSKKATQLVSDMENQLRSKVVLVC